MADGSGHDSGHDSGAELALDESAAITPVRRRALWGVLAVVALVTGGVVVASSNDEGSPRLPVALGSASTAESDSAGASLSIARAWVTYVPGEDLPALGGRAAAYRLTSAVDASSVQALATALGMDGPPVREGESWLLEQDGAVLQVDVNSGSWWYSINNGDVAIAEDIARDEQCAADGPGCEMRAVEPAEPGEPPTKAVLPEPGPPAPPVDLPSKAEVREVALDLIAATGRDVTDVLVTIDGGYDAWYVTIEHRVDGVPASSWTSTVGVGAKSVITSASGWLAQVERVGDYPLIDTRAAIDRLNDLHGGFGGGPVPLDGDVPVDTELYDPVAPEITTEVGGTCKVQPDGIEICEVVPALPAPECPPDADCAGGEPYPYRCEDVVITTVPGEPVTPNTAIASDSAASCLAPEPGVPSEPYEPPAPVEVVLTEAEPVLTLMPSTDGSHDMYLVPGYRFSGEDGALVEVAAIEDESLAPVAGVGEPRTEPAPQPPERGTLTLEPGAEPELGVGYYVDVNTHCGWFTFADRWWATDASTPLRGWAEPTEGGTFTLESPDEGVFTGDYEGTKQARFTAQGPADELPPCD